MNNCNFSTPLSSGGFSLIHPRSAWRQCYSTKEMSSLLSHWLMQFTGKKRTRQKFQVLLQKCVMKNMVEYMSRPKIYSNALCAARHIHNTLLVFMWMGKPSNRHPLQNKKWPLRSETSGPKKVVRPALVDKSKVC